MTDHQKFLTGPDPADDDLAGRKRLQARPSIIDCRRPNPFRQNAPPFRIPSPELHIAPTVPVEGKALSSMDGLTASKHAREGHSSVVPSPPSPNDRSEQSSSPKSTICCRAPSGGQREKKEVDVLFPAHRPGSQIFTNTFRSIPNEPKEAEGTPKGVWPAVARMATKKERSQMEEPT